MTTLERTTRETRVRVSLARAGGADATVRVDTGAPFLDHMLVTLARYAGLALEIDARGDLRHHLAEDVAIVLGEALRREIPPTCARFGDRTVPMDDALVQAAVDLVGRPYWRGPLPSTLYDHVLRSFTDSARLTLHVRVLRGRDRHHVIEAAFKAVGLALRDALAEGGTVFSTKGSVEWKEGA
jgi:imidazoleglycerol-phosphate dehydratase